MENGGLTRTVAPGVGGYDGPERLAGTGRVYHAERRRKGERCEAEGMAQVIQAWKNRVHYI